MTFINTSKHVVFVKSFTVINVQAS